MIPSILIDAIADEGKALADLAAQLGRKIAIDPRALLERDIALQPPGLFSPNGYCRLVAASDGWIAVNLAREDDRAAISAWLECDETADPWVAVTNHARHRTTATLVERATLLGMPVAALKEARAQQSYPLAPNLWPQNPPSVLDLSALWAGPLCGGLLAQAGMAVTKVEDPARPDPTAITTPDHNHRLNGHKRRLTMPLHSPDLLDAVAGADILITSARAHALARLGLTPQTLFARNPGLIWVAITAHGFAGENAMRVGFGDDTAAAGGLVGWTGDAPQFLGDALADPLTGLRAAHLALRAITARQSGLIDVALAATAADFATKAGLR